ncbi:hypothetical protein NC651_017270 [Populus alba x Populus x berolinensis]|nr:hypothetical protein NC651_017270 [Populus alba x Populus x berolinensis]
MATIQSLLNFTSYVATLVTAKQDNRSISWFLHPLQV